MRQRSHHSETVVRFIFDWCEHSDSEWASAVVEDLEVFEDRVGQLDPGAPAFAVQEFGCLRPENDSMTVLSEHYPANMGTGACAVPRVWRCSAGLATAGGFEAAESFFLLADPVGECFEPGAEVGDLGGECGECARVAGLLVVFVDDRSEAGVAVEGGAADAGWRSPGFTDGVGVG